MSGRFYSNIPHMRFPQFQEKTSEVVCTLAVQALSQVKPCFVTNESSREP